MDESRKTCERNKEKHSTQHMGRSLGCFGSGILTSRQSSSFPSQQYFSCDPSYNRGVHCYQKQDETLCLRPPLLQQHRGTPILGKYGVHHRLCVHRPKSREAHVNTTLPTVALERVSSVKLSLYLSSSARLSLPSPFVSSSFVTLLFHIIYRSPPRPTPSREQARFPLRLMISLHLDSLQQNRLTCRCPHLGHSSFRGQREIGVRRVGARQFEVSSSSSPSMCIQPTLSLFVEEEVLFPDLNSTRRGVKLRNRINSRYNEGPPRNYARESPCPSLCFNAYIS